MFHKSNLWRSGFADDVKHDEEVPSKKVGNTDFFLNMSFWLVYMSNLHFKAYRYYRQILYFYPDKWCRSIK